MKKEKFDLDYYGGSFKEKTKNYKWIFWVILISLFTFATIWFVDLIQKFKISTETSKIFIQNNTREDSSTQNYDWLRKKYIDYLTLKNKISESNDSIVKFKLKLPKDSLKWNLENKSQLMRLQIIVDRLDFKKTEIVNQYNNRSETLRRNSLIKEDELPDELK